jgi:hypothetical protein
MKHEWRQPFHWGLLLAFDDVAPLEVPEVSRKGAITASATCLSVPVLHAQDIAAPEGWPADQPLPLATVEVRVVVGEDEDVGSAEFDGRLSCPSGRLRVGDAENELVIDVPPGNLRVRVVREPIEFAEHVTVQLIPALEVPLGLSQSGMMNA